MWKLLTIAWIFFSGSLWAENWSEIKHQAKNQTVYFYGWGGNAQVNDYIHWASQEIKRLHDINLIHVKVGDISEAVTLILSEKSSGRDSQGRVDMLWVNGENFASLKQADLLYGPFTDQLPNFERVDKRLPVDVDFSTPVEGLEAPWGVGQMVMMFDSNTTARTPASAQELLEYAQQHPGSSQLSTATTISWRNLSETAFIRAGGTTPSPAATG